MVKEYIEKRISRTEILLDDTCRLIEKMAQEDLWEAVEQVEKARNIIIKLIEEDEELLKKVMIK